MKIETYKYEDATVYSIVPVFGKTLSIKVEPDAPVEAHEDAKEQLKSAMKSRTIKNTTKRETRHLLYRLADWLK
jgi:hypothetical protein